MISGWINVKLLRNNMKNILILIATSLAEIIATIILPLMILNMILNSYLEEIVKKENIQPAKIINTKEERKKEILNQIPVIKIPETGHMVIMSNKSLRESRNSYSTKIIAESFTDSGRILTPPRDTYILTKYPTQLGDMTTYVTPDPKDGKRHPAVIWISGGYGGLSDSEDFFWREHDRDNDQSASAFRKAGLVVMLPSFRGEDKNPGRFEMFYGELDDIEAAYDWLSKQSYVDPERIYLAGHSTGGTRVLLASEYSTKFRGYFSLGGLPDLKARVECGEMSVTIPFKQTKKEFQLRSPARYIKSIKNPTWYFEGEENYWQAFDNIEKVAKKEKIPLFIYKIPYGDHFNIIAPLTEMIAEKILADTGRKSNITFSDKDIAKISHDLLGE